MDIYFFMYLYNHTSLLQIHINKIVGNLQRYIFIFVPTKVVKY